MKRIHLVMVLIFAVALLGLAATAQAQTWAGGTGEGGGGEVHLDCACVDEVNNNFEFCAENVACTAVCPATPCLAGTICIDAVNDCGAATCVPVCPDEFNCQDLHVFGAGAPFPECPKNIPTLSQWGLILFGMLLLTTMFIVIRRRGLPTQMTASLLVLLAVGVLATGASYAEIQSNRGCGETDVAVEFVNDILNS